MAFDLRDKDNGYRRFMELCEKGTQAVDVGILPEDANLPHGESGRTLGEIAAAHEFGDPDGNLGNGPSPERSFVREWFRQNRDEVLRRIRAAAVQAFLHGDHSFYKELERVGLWAQGSIQQRISDGIPPPNAESTIRRKGSSTPLIDTGQLRTSIKYRVKR